MNTDDKIYIGALFLFYYIGDIATTYLGLKAGGYEANPLLSSIGFGGTVLLKTVFIVYLWYVLNKIVESANHPHWKKHNINPHVLKGVAIGAVLMVGVMAVLINTGVYS